MYQLIHSILLISFLLPSLGLAQRSPKEQTKDTPWTKAQWEQLDALFATDEPEQVQPGLAFALLHRGELIYQQTPGYANLEHQIPLNAQSCFDIASLAKQFTGLSVAILIEEGKLSLQDDVRQYLPEVPDFGHPITIAHLLYHTSGLRDIGELHAVGPYLDELTAKMCLEIVSHQQELNFVPGTENDYSNTGYVLLALIVERVSGTSFVDWTKAHVFQPLGMKNSFFNDDPQALIPLRATAYYGSVEEGFSYPQNNGMALVSSSAVYTNLKDLILWQQHIRQPPADFQKAFALIKQSGQLDNGESIGYGMGLSVQNIRGLQMFEHTGSTPAGFRTLLAYFPDLDFSMIILSNWGNKDPLNDYAFPIMEILYPQHFAPAQANKKAEPAIEEDFVVSAERLAQYVGDYQNGDSFVARFRLDGEQLSIQLPNQDAQVLQAVGPDRFFFPPMNAMLYFEADEKGIMRRIIVKDNGQIVADMHRLEQEEMIKPSLDLHEYAGVYYSEELGLWLRFSLKEGVLQVEHPKYGISFLEPEKTDTFGAYSSLGKVEFRRNQEQQIIGFTLYRGSRLRKLDFRKC